jgi:hypothetical protein
MKSILTLLCVVIAGSSVACDFCGCFMGITPYDNQSSIAMIYRYKMYSGYAHSSQSHYLFHRNVMAAAGDPMVHPGNYNTLKHGSMGTAEPVSPQYLQSDYELYTSAELRAKYFLHKRIELSMILPFQVNESRTAAHSEHVHGLGDLTLMAAYHLIEHTLTDKTQHRLSAGYGIKLPTGSAEQSDANGERIDFLLQTGTGSVDHILFMNYILAGKKFGASLNAAYKINGENDHRERISNSSTAYLNIFYKFRQAKDLKFFPSLQLYHEYCKGVYTGNVYEQGTAMNNLTGGIGIDIFYRQFALNAAYHFPLYEQELEGNLSEAGKFMVGITFSFNQKKYLLKSKKES